MRGLGAFADHASDPAFMAGWSQIQSQLTAEGAPAAEMDAAKSLYASSVEQLFAQPDVPAQQAIDSAKQLVIAGKTVAGAVGQVTQLAQSIARGAPFPDVATQIIGVTIGLGVTLGVVSAGVGAAIVGAVQGLLSVLKSIPGLFPSPPQGKQIPCGQNGNDTVYCGSDDPSSWPNRNIDCVCVWDGGQAGIIVPGSPNWRSFPDPGSAADAQWFQGQNNFQWKGATWASPSPAEQAVEAAFSPYWHLLVDAKNTHPGLDDFLAHYFVAWKANREYALNGLQPRPDWEVLVHVTRIWNKAHATGAGIDLQYVQFVEQPTTVSDVQNNAAAFPTPYIASLVQQIVNNNQSDVLNGSALHINTGALSGLRLNPNVIVRGGGTSPTTTMSVPAKVALVTAGAAGAGALTIAVVAWAKHETFGHVLGRTWDWVKHASSRSPKRKRRDDRRRPRAHR